MASNISSNTSSHALEAAEIQNPVEKPSLGDGELDNNDEYPNSRGSQEDRRMHGHDSSEDPKTTLTLISQLQDPKCVENARRKQQSPADTLTSETNSPDSHCILGHGHHHGLCRQGKHGVFSHEPSWVAGSWLGFAQGNCKKGLEHSLPQPSFGEDTINPVTPSHALQVVRRHPDLQLDDQITAAGVAPNDQSPEHTPTIAPRRRLSQSDSGTGSDILIPSQDQTEETPSSSSDEPRKDASMPASRRSLSQTSAHEKDVDTLVLPDREPRRLPATSHSRFTTNTLLVGSPRNSQDSEDLQETPAVSTTSSTNGAGGIDALKEQLFDAVKGELFYTLTRSQDRTKSKTAVLNIATLQHMALHHLQYQISHYVEDMYDASTFIPSLIGQPSLHELMGNYADAVRNSDFMAQCALRGYEEDPFLVKSSRTLERQVMKTISLIPKHVLPGGRLPMAQDHEHPKLRGMGRNAANEAAYRKKRLLRFAMAVLGALLLVIPMVIMTIVVGKAASLITTCVSMLVFAILITMFTELGPNEVLGTTAAYAAVLVVFVGTSVAG
ncbi:hypothetical protein LTR37_011977 [Vermiconidia calcicola]|uniref:Uncharacterized protein n=1 Tax=Vermiconidia calcicola TaxID=1690605 RepID=A0ACC3N158_9PEZI|nr:hypothetical protein LTR37_011977 [Vermiconidia calcicola]